MTSETRPRSASRQPDLEVGAERPGELLGDELLEPTAVDTPDHLADQVPVVEHVVPRPVAGSPPRRLRGEPGGGFAPSRRSSSLLTGWSQPATPDVCAIRWRTSIRLLAVGRELGPVLRDGRERVEPAALDQQQRAERHHRLGGGPHVGDRVLRPGPGRGPRRPNRPRGRRPSGRRARPRSRRRGRLRSRELAPSSSRSSANFGSQVPWTSAMLSLLVGDGRNLPPRRDVSAGEPAVDQVRG